MILKKLRDAVHKDIYIDQEELALLDTAEMQRLRGIRQLGAAFYVYPSAQHTRFEHSIGTCWMAKRIVAGIESAGCALLPDVEKKAIYLASLVHDVTHIPFGHTFEDERRLLAKHDRSEGRYKYFFLDSPLGRIMDSTEEGRLARLMLSPAGSLPADKQYLRQIVSGTICADLLDYLKRDNYFCGLSYQFDERVLHYFDIVGGQLVLNLQQRGLFRRDALTEVTNLLRIRYVLSERVYYHHAKIAAGVMISKAIERAMAAGLREDQICRLTDHALIYCLEQDYGKDPAVRDLISAFKSRRLFKRCYMLTRTIGEQEVRDLVGKYHYNEDDARTGAEGEIARLLGAEPHHVAIYCSPEEMALKEADVPVIVRTEAPMKLSDLNSAEIEVLKSQHRALWKFYVFLSRDLSDRREKAGEICSEVIGLPNELPAKLRGDIV